MTAGPPLERLTRRLAETPDEFLAEPRIGGSGTVATAALIGDLFQARGHATTTAEMRTLAGADRNRLILTAVALWLIADDWAAKASCDELLDLLGPRLDDLATAGRAELFVSDVDRREELARTVLAALALVPEGETPAQAADRLSAVSAAERRRLLRASQAAEARARAVREALIRKAAEESADKYTRE